MSLRIKKLLSFNGWVLIFWLLLVQSGLAQEPLAFQSGEHIYLGNNVQLYFPVKDGDKIEFKQLTGAETDFNSWLKLNINHPITFGKIVAVPDYFADPDIVIAAGKDLAERQAFFARCFAAFMHANTKSLNGVLAIMDDEVKLIKKALDQGIDPSKLYGPKDDSFNLRYAAADPLMIKLALNDFDHFGKDTWSAYHAGHTTAIATALQAHNEPDQLRQAELLVLAYAQEAYADHFLTDSFAAGHMRTPRRELNTISVGDNGSFKAVGSVLSMLMHNEDNKYGLQGTNAFGEQWLAYGDDRCLDAADYNNKQMMDAALQASADEVTLAFTDGKVIPSDQYAAQNYIANIDKFYDYIHYIDSLAKTVPLFVYDNEHHTLLRRRDINQLHPLQPAISLADMKPHGGAKGWWGLTTLLELKLAYHPDKHLAGDANVLNGLVDADGKLNTAGLQKLAGALTKFERKLFCADTATSNMLRQYLQCNVVN